MSDHGLRRAAEIMRERAANVMRHSGGKDRWFEADIDLRNAIHTNFLGNVDSAPDDARWIATMHPGVGLVLADWLDEMADGYEWCEERWQDAHEAACEKVHGYESALEVTRLINGGE